MKTQRYRIVRPWMHGEAPTRPQRPATRPSQFNRSQVAQLRALLAGRTFRLLYADARLQGRTSLEIVGHSEPFTGTPGEILDAVRDAVRAREAVQR